MRRRGALPFRRIWVVYCDHSSVGFWPTKREAVAAVRLREREGIAGIDHYIVGPYVLSRRGAR